MNSFFEDWPTFLDNIGVHALGVIPAGDLLTWPEYEQIIQSGVPANLQYLVRNASCRKDFDSVLPGTKSVVGCAVAMPEFPKNIPCRYARFCALGDYHQVLRQKLALVDARLRQQYPIQNSRVCVDSAPVLEREVAVRAGIGDIGFNRLVIHEQYGSFIALGELLVDVDISHDAGLLGFHTTAQPSGALCPGQVRCCPAGKRICVQSCPTGALSESGYDFNKCLSYWSTQHKGEIPVAYANAMGDMSWGCDRCQTPCPRQRANHLSPAESPLYHLTLRDILTSSANGLRKRCFGSPLADAHPCMLQRNACIVIKNTYQTEYLPLLENIVQNHACDWVQATAWRVIETFRT